jgi:predicted metal-dependent peptidase
MNDVLPPVVSRARIQLMLRHTYLASATAQLRFRVSQEAWCRTMATDGHNVFINEGFAASLSEEDVMGVIAHEVLHCVLGHIDRRGTRDSKVWNLAIDYATNLILHDSSVALPEGALLDRKYAGMTAEDIYDRLEELSPQVLGRLLESTGEAVQPSIRQSAPAIFRDIHLAPEDPRGIWARAGDYPTELDRQRLRSTWQSELLANLPGTETGHISEEIKKAGRQEIDWREYFSRFVTGLRRDDYRIFPPNKKHIWRNIYLPSFGSPGPDHIVIAIDTSGSMDEKILGKVLTEIDAARQTCECRLTILHCDTEITSVETLEPWELLDQDFESMHMHGRGGTVFSPPFDWISEYVKDGNSWPDALIYMTDGFGQCPAIVPPYPCLWIVPENGSAKFSFGDVVTVSTS